MFRQTALLILLCRPKTVETCGRGNQTVTLRGTGGELERLQ